MLTLGGLVTLGSYAMADGGGTYVVTTGLLLVGAYNFLRGLYYQIKYSSVSKY
jgi:hypothetical protein